MAIVSVHYIKPISERRDTVKKRWVYGLLPVAGVLALQFALYSEAKGVKVDFEQSVRVVEGDAAGIPAKKTVRIKLPDKWERYSDFEALKHAKQAEVYVPGELPAGYRLQYVEAQGATFRGIYTNENETQTLLFSQSPAERDAPDREGEWSRQGNETKLTWSSAGHRFELSASGLERQDFIRFQNSLRLLRNMSGIMTLPFEVIAEANLTDASRGQKDRSFTLFTPQTWKEFVRKQRDKVEEKREAAKDELLIGLFAGEKGSSGYSIAASSVTMQDGRITVMFHELQPLPDMDYLTVLTYPFQVIKVDIPSGYPVTSVQFVTGNGEAIANLAVPPNE